MDPLELSFTPAPIPDLPEVENETPDERKRRSAGRFLEFHRSMDGLHETMQQGCQKRIEQTGRLLREALAEARDLANSSGA